jgi:diacylglycerol kinase (ATP)
MKFLKSFYYALVGIRKALGSERNLKIQLCCAILTILAGFILKVSNVEWAIIIFCIGLVLTSEMFNTATEKLLNHLNPEFHPIVGLIKDISAGAVLIAATSSFIVALILFIPKMASLWFL